MESKNKRDEDLKKVEKLAEKIKDDKLLKSVKKRKENSNICKDGKDEN